MANYLFEFRSDVSQVHDPNRAAKRSSRPRCVEKSRGLYDVTPGARSDRRILNVAPSDEPQADVFAFRNGRCQAVNAEETPEASP